MPDGDIPSTDLPELLAPAGGRDALTAAVRNGADAVYLGLSTLNARRGAENFTLGELREACDFAHLRGVRVYLAANALVLPKEMGEALTLVDQAWEAGVDAVIVQDLGLMSLVRRTLPHVRLHASTQVGAYDSGTVRVLAELGCARVTLARELAIPEIATLSASTAVETESFVHGALCFCYSGQCLMSSLIGARSANRGLCAQPCRLPYDLITPDGETVEAEGRYLLSPKDLAGAGSLPELVASGSSALKIEGRMKGPEYVALVVGVYRALLDRVSADPDAFDVTQGEWEVLEEAFNRGFTDGYLHGASDERVMGRTRPNNRGVRVGRVVSVEGRRATVRLDRALDSRDRIEFWTGRGRLAQETGPLRFEGRERTGAPAGSDVVISIEGPLAPGDRVFRVANAALLDAARRTFTGAAEKRPVPLDVRVELRVDAPLAVEVSAGGHRARAEGPVVEPARTRAITAEEVMEHAGRLGGTPYAPSGWDIRLDAAAGLGFSALHRARREAVESLDAARLADYRARRAVAPRLPVLEEPSGTGAPRLVARVTDAGTAAACVEAGADEAFLEVDEATPPTGVPDGVWPVLPRVARDGESSVLAGWARAAGRGVAGTLGTLALVLEGATQAQADWALNVLNPYSADVLACLGAEAVWASPEASRETLAAIAAGSPVPVGVGVFGAQEVMVAEHCLLRAVGPCAGVCPSCTRRSGAWSLEDRKGVRFRVRVDASGRSHVHNSRTLDLTHVLPDVLSTGVSMVGVDLVLEDPAAAVEITRAVRSRLDAALAGVAAGERIADEATGGHFFRGVA